MKIGIITLYDYYNCGSFLQAYAMKKYLNGLGHEVFFIRTQSIKRRIRRAFISADKSVDYIGDIIKILKFQRDFCELKQISAADIGNLDAVIIGSDELWNADNDSFNQYPFYYGIGYESLPTMVYAMSMGNGNEKTLLKKDYIVPAIKKIDNIYARDFNTVHAIEAVVHRKIDIVCDPTLLIEADAYLQKNKRVCNQPYILVYSYDLPKFLSPLIQSFAKENNLKIVSTCFRLDIADIEVNCRPMEFPEIVKNAKYVITSTFHGSIFSVVLKKNLLVIPYARKTEDFLKMIALEDRIISESITYTKFCGMLNTLPDYRKTNKILNEMKIYSKSIISSFLQGNKDGEE